MSMAGEGDQYFNISAGFLFNRTLNATIGYEREMDYGNAVELYAELGNQWQRDPKDDKVYNDTFWKGYYWDGGILYKMSLKRFKNSMLRARLGVQTGARTGDYFFGIEGGIRV